jgi:hypothetical protein
MIGVDQALKTILGYINPFDVGRLCRCQGKMSVNMLSDYVSSLLINMDSKLAAPGMIL